MAMHPLYFVEFIYNIKTNELPTFDENHNKLNAHGFKILNPP